MKKTHKTCKICGQTKEMKDFRDEHGNIKTCLQCELQKMKESLAAAVASTDNDQPIYAYSKKTKRSYRIYLDQDTQKYVNYRK